MTYRSLSQIISATATSDGAGVALRRSIGTSALKHLDPFLMLDHFGSEHPDDYLAGFPDHPHRGFITLTYMLDGHMEHRDSMGNQGDLKAGGVQWMKAASGVIHSEMPKQSQGRMRGFQLWINLPARDKMSDPAYQEYTADAIPVVDASGVQVRILAGEHADRRGIIEDPVTELLYLDIGLSADTCFERPLCASHNAFLYVYEGEIDLAGHTLTTHQVAVLGDGDAVSLSAGQPAARFILVAGRPLGEPIVQQGPFVMNTREEILQAFDDYRSGRLVRVRASVTGA